MSDCKSSAADMALDFNMKNRVFLCFFEKFSPITCGLTAPHIRNGRVHPPGTHLPDESQFLSARLP